MAEEKNETTTETTDEGISEDDLRKMIGEEIDSRLSSVTDAIGGLTDSIVDKLKGEGTSGVSEESLLEKIGGMIDEKMKGVSANGSKTKEPHKPKLRIFT